MTVDEPPQRHSDRLRMNGNAIVSDDEKGDECEDTLRPEAEHHVADQRVQVAHEGYSHRQKCLKFRDELASRRVGQLDNRPVP